MSDLNDDAAHIKAISDAILKKWADQGKIIEGGWVAFVAVSGLQKAPANQLNAMRKAYMVGAQHLFASIMQMLDPGGEPSEGDMRRMDLIARELETFRRSLVN